MSMPLPPVPLLRTLGGLTLIRSNPLPAGVGVQRKRLILLALLAAYNRGGGVSRDRLLGLLWPESSDFNARNALNQALFGLRKELGDDVVVGGGELRLDLTVVECDLVCLWRADRDGDPEQVVASYTGPFLDGVYVADAEELTRWIEETRAGTERLYRDALLTLARRARSAEEAVRWWRLLAVAAPLDASIACSLMTALVTNGDRASALAHSRVYSAMVTSQLGIEPDGCIVALAREIASGGETRGLPSVQKPATIGEPLSLLASMDVRVPEVPGRPPESGASREGSASVQRRPRWMVPGSIFGGALMGAVVLATMLHHASARPVDRRDTVVFPFRLAVSDSSLAYLSEGIADLLGPALAQKGHALPADAHSLAVAWRDASRSTTNEMALVARVTQRVGASRAIIGTVVGSRSRLNVSAELVSADGHLIGRSARASGPADSVLAIVDRLASALLAGEATSDAVRFTDLTTRSPSALRRYLDGASALRGGNSDLAATAFRDALRQDSTFALAALGVATAGGWASSTLAERLKRGFALGWRLRTALTPEERALFDAAVGPYNPADDSDKDDLERWSRAAQLAPERADVAYELGDRLLHTGQYLNVPDSRGAAARSFALAVSRDSSQLVALEHLIELAILARDMNRAGRLFRTYVMHDSDAAIAPYLAWRIAIATGDSAAIAEIRSRFDQLPSISLRRIAGMAQLDGVALGDGARALAVLAERPEGGHEHQLTLYRLHAMALNSGSAIEGSRLLDSLALERSELSDAASVIGDAEDLAILDALFSIGSPSRGDAVARRPPALDSVIGDAVARRHACTRAMWRVARGADASGAAALRLLQQGPHAEPATATADGWQPAVCIRGLTAEIAVRQRSPDARAEVLRLDSLMQTGPHGFGFTFGNLWAASLLLRVHEPALALRAAMRRRRDWDDVLYLADMDASAIALYPRGGDVQALDRLRSHLHALRGRFPVPRLQ